MRRNRNSRSTRDKPTGAEFVDQVELAGALQTFVGGSFEFAIETPALHLAHRARRQVGQRAAGGEIGERPRLRVHHAENADGEAVPRLQGGARVELDVRRLRHQNAAPDWLDRARIGDPHDLILLDGLVEEQLAARAADGRQPVPCDGPHLIRFDEHQRGVGRIEHLRGEARETIENIAWLGLEKIKPRQSREACRLEFAALGLVIQILRFNHRATLHPFS